MTDWVLFHPYPDDVGKMRHLAVAEVKSRNGGVKVAYGLNPNYRLLPAQVVGEFDSEARAEEERGRLRATSQPGMEPQRGGMRPNAS